MAELPQDPAYLTATEALDAFRARKLSPLEVLDAQIARIEAHNPGLNLITYEYFERAREQEASLRTLARRSGPV